MHILASRVLGLLQAWMLGELREMATLYQFAEEAASQMGARGALGESFLVRDVKVKPLDTEYLRYSQ